MKTAGSLRIRAWEMVRYFPRKK